MNFAFTTKNGVASSPANPQHPEHFTPDLKNDFLMNSGDQLRVHMFDTSHGFTVTVDDLTTGTHGSMVASAANGFGVADLRPERHHVHGGAARLPPDVQHRHAGRSQLQRRAHRQHQLLRRDRALRVLRARSATTRSRSCAKPLGDDTNDGDVGPDPAGDDNFCLPASASTKVKIGGCLDTDGDFDSVSYKFTWPGSISNPIADQLLNASPVRFTSPSTNGKYFETMAFESNISRSESDDTAFRVDVFCQRHITNPADPHPGVGCVNPPPNSNFYPFYTTISSAGACWWQQGGPYIPGTTNKFGGSAAKEYGPLRVISYPTAPFGTVTTRYNDFRSEHDHEPLHVGLDGSRPPGSGGSALRRRPARARACACGRLRPLTPDLP